MSTHPRPLPATTLTQQVDQIRLLLRDLVLQHPIISQNRFDFGVPAQGLAVDSNGIVVDEQTGGDGGEEFGVGSDPNEVL